jgi:hypothetical protein
LTGSICRITRDLYICPFNTLFKDTAHYAPRCAGKTLAFVVQYAPLKKPPESNPAASIRFVAPNRFVVEFDPYLPIAEAAKAPAPL